MSSNIEIFKGKKYLEVKNWMWNPVSWEERAGGVHPLDLGATILKVGKQSNCMDLKMAKDDMDF